MVIGDRSKSVGIVGDNIMTRVRYQTKMYWKSMDKHIKFILPKLIGTYVPYGNFRIHDLRRMISLNN